MIEVSLHRYLKLFLERWRYYQIINGKKMLEIKNDHYSFRWLFLGVTLHPRQHKLSVVWPSPIYRFSFPYKIEYTPNKKTETIWRKDVGLWQMTDHLFNIPYYIYQIRLGAKLHTTIKLFKY